MMIRRRVWVIAAVALLLAGVVTAVVLVRTGVAPMTKARQTGWREARIREALFAEVTPVKLANCQLERFGEAHDGGYLMCANLLSSVEAAYSYGIAGYDGWGCDISRKLGVSVHQYDCFDLRHPSCPGGDAVFHAECVGAQPSSDEGRLFDTLRNQIARNGDAARRLVVKMDVEGAEWDSFLYAPDTVFEGIDQLQVEFHHVDEVRFVAAMQRVKQFFYIAHVHVNNVGCGPGVQPFPSSYFEVLFVSKRLGVPDPSGSAAGVSPLDAANNPGIPDCQIEIFSSPSLTRR